MVVGDIHNRRTRTINMNVVESRLFIDDLTRGSTQPNWFRWAPIQKAS